MLDIGGFSGVVDGFVLMKFYYFVVGYYVKKVGVFFVGEV